MSSRIHRLQALAAIPQISSATVAVADRFVLGVRIPDSVSPAKFLQVPFTNERHAIDFGVLILTAGTHANFVATIEGSMEGTVWFGLQRQLAPATGLTVGTPGISFAAAVGAPGFAVRLVGSWQFYRFGLAGDNAAADGTAELLLALTRDF